MNVQSALVDQMQMIALEAKRQNKEIAKINSQAIYDNILVIISSNKTDAYIVDNKEKINMILKMAQDKINAM